MPDWNLESTWEAAYRIRGGLPNEIGFGEILSYLDGRKFAVQVANDGVPGLSFYRRTLAKMGVVPNFSPAADALIVGCGFGWLVEALIDLGGNGVWGTDISTIIQSLLNDPGVDVRADVLPRILDIDVMDLDASNQFKTAGAGNNKGEFRWIVTELVMESFDPVNDAAGFNAFCDSLDQLKQKGQANVLHVVAQDLPSTTNNHDESLGMTWLTLDEWAAYRPDHLWLDIQTGQMAGA